MTVTPKKVVTARTCSGNEYNNTFSFYSHKEILQFIFTHFGLNANNITKTGEDKYFSDCGVMVTIKYK
jgi:hypothetical protein